MRETPPTMNDGVVIFGPKIKKTHTHISVKFFRKPITSKIFMAVEVFLCTRAIN